MLDRVKKGRVVLFLGSGALYGAKLTGDKKIPLGNDLRDILCDEFLSGDFKHEQLSHVSAMAISAYSLVAVQTFIARVTLDLVHPASNTRLGDNTDACRLASKRRKTYVKDPL
ncbi:MAG: hypothetical protein ACJAVV_003437, partial [Alphaproteobacteria bacterium]